MSDTALPVSVSITHQQLAWLDRRRRRGPISRSAALRQVLDAVMQLETQQFQRQRQVAEPLGRVQPPRRDHDC